MIRRRLPVCVYNRCITFLYGDLKQINAYLKSVHKAVRAVEPWQDLRDSCKGHWSVAAHNGYESDYICVVRTGRVRNQRSVLAHEIVHHVGHTLRMAGIQHTEETEEAYAYYFQWVFDKCLAIMERK